jgi:hypothetical protein
MKFALYTLTALSAFIGTLVLVVNGNLHPFHARVVIGVLIVGSLLIGFMSNNPTKGK